MLERNEQLIKEMENVKVQNINLREQVAKLETDLNIFFIKSLKQGYHEVHYESKIIKFDGEKFENVKITTQRNERIFKNEYLIDILKNS